MGAPDGIDEGGGGGGGGNGGDVGCTGPRPYGLNDVQGWQLGGGGSEE